MPNTEADVDAHAHRPAPSGGGTGARLRGLWSFRGRYRILHLSWFAFFLSFVVWFNFAPFATTIGDDLGLSRAQLGTLALCNVALTVPARIVVGMALDRFGPRQVFSAILVYAAIPCLVFATADSFPVLVASRLALGVVGAGFVVGIRMVSEWFPPRELGTAEGIYGGWGNFGAAAAAFTLPVVASWVGGDDGWRWAIAVTGLMAAAYGLAYRRLVTDTPDGARYVRPRRQGALEVTSRGAVFGLAALSVPIVGALVLVGWQVHDVGALSAAGLAVVVALAAALLAFQVRQVFRVNGAALRDEYEPADRYPFRSVAVLCLGYFCTFGSELAVVSMLPTFFSDTFGLDARWAGWTASAFAWVNLVARPGGGLLSDLMGSRRRTLRVILVGLVAGYAGMALVGPGWPVALAVAMCMVCSLFVQSGAGAVFAIVPLVKKRVSGQIAGLAGAYGNVGAVVFLTALLYVTPAQFFLVIAASSVVGVVACRWLEEPANSFAADLVTDTPEPPPAPPTSPADPAGHSGEPELAPSAPSVAAM